RGSSLWNNARKKGLLGLPLVETNRRAVRVVGVHQKAVADLDVFLGGKPRLHAAHRHHAVAAVAGQSFDKLRHFFLLSFAGRTYVGTQTPPLSVEPCALRSPSESIEPTNTTRRSPLFSVVLPTVLTRSGLMSTCLLSFTVALMLAARTVC